MIPRLHEVTVVAIDCVAHRLTRRAVEDTLSQIEPANVLIWSDQIEAVPRGAVWIQCPALRSLRDVAALLWWHVPFLVNTSHFLLVQWDGWVLDSREWTPGFLNYDYIGAPWWYGDALNVGNGGFSLRSVRLGRYLSEHVDEFPMVEPEDVTLCRRYRQQLEPAGFVWAPEPVAGQFAFERTRLVGRTFGFHGHFHWPALLTGDRLQERIALANDYVLRKPLF